MRKASGSPDASSPRPTFLFPHSSSTLVHESPAQPSSSTSFGGFLFLKKNLLHAFFIKYNFRNMLARKRRQGRRRNSGKVIENCALLRKRSVSDNARARGKRVPREFFFPRRAVFRRNPVSSGERSASGGKGNAHDQMVCRARGILYNLSKMRVFRRKNGRQVFILGKPLGTFVRET